MDDESKPKAMTSHVVGQDISLLSLDEIRLRIEALRQEIARLEQACADKEKSRASADAFFKK